MPERCPGDVPEKAHPGQGSKTRNHEGEERGILAGIGRYHELCTPEDRAESPQVEAEVKTRLELRLYLGQGPEDPARSAVEGELGQGHRDSTMLARLQPAGFAFHHEADAMVDRIEVAR